MRRATLTALQVVITLAIVWWVFRDPAKRTEVVATLGRADAAWLAVGFFGYGLVELLAAWRWQILLRVQHFTLGFPRVCALTMTGVFFNFFIPGGTGGDAVKMFYLVKETPGRRGLALLSVVVDRLIGLLALIVFAGVLIAWKWRWLSGAPQTLHWVWLALAVLGGGLVFLAVCFVITGAGLVHRLPQRTPGREKLAELALAFNVYGRAWRPALAAFVLSLVAHVGYFGVFYCAIRALAGDGKVPGLGEFYAFIPIIGTITSLPLSLGGVGWREQMFQDFLGALCGIPAGAAVAMASSGYLLTLGWGLLGGLIYLLYRPSDHARLREIRAEVRALEHELAEEEIAGETGDREENIGSRL